MFYERLTAFFNEWFAVPERFTNKNGIVENEAVIVQFIGFLIEHNVFTKEELRKEALKTHNIILPHRYFNV